VPFFIHLVITSIDVVVLQTQGAVRITTPTLLLMVLDSYGFVTFSVKVSQESSIHLIPTNLTFVTDVVEL
jgi:hypothetical protein